MTEHIKTHPEQHERHEAREHLSSAEQQAKPETSTERTPDQHAAELRAIQATIEKEAKHAHEVPVDKHERPEPTQMHVNKELKQAAFDRLIARTRKHLSAPNRLLSDITHQPVVDTISRAGEKTIARPTPLLSGGICALAGSTILLYMAKHNGYTYNLTIFFVLFIAGFVIGVAIDLVRFVLHRRHGNNQAG